MPKALCKQSKQLIASLISYFEQERDNGGPLIPVTAVRERVANALQLSLPTVSSVSQTVKSNELIKSPKRKKLRTKPVVGIDNFDQVAIRNVIYEMYQYKGISVSSDPIRNKHEGMCTLFPWANDRDTIIKDLGTGVTETSKSLLEILTLEGLTEKIGICSKHGNKHKKNSKGIKIV